MVLQTIDIPQLLVDTVWCEFHRCRREDSRAPTVALVEKLVAFREL